MTTTLVLEPPCAFINANDRLHHHAKAKLTRAWRTIAANAIDDGWHPDHYPAAHITVAIRFPTNHRRDVGNYYPTAKAIVDGLVDALLLPDDNDAHLIGPDLRRERPNGTPRVTVTIQELT
jgi:crossover junction endodeoxyribonuclease RusA